MLNGASGRMFGEDSSAGSGTGSAGDSETSADQILALAFPLLPPSATDTRIPPHHGSDHVLRRAWSTVCKGLCEAGQEVHEAGSKGVPEDCSRDGDRIRDHGVHWILRQADPHPHQQYHCVSITF